MNEIIKETQREAIINRPHNLAGSVKSITRNRYNILENGVKYEPNTITPALLKLFLEALDNPIDVAIKSNSKIKIDIKVTPEYIQIKDNGYGIPSVKINSNWQAWDAFCDYNTSSNYKENKGQGQKGVNGIGVKLCTTLSKKMIIDSDDGYKKIHIIATENNLNHKITEKPSTGSGITIKFYPDFNIFDVNEITDEHIKRMYEYTLIQALTYPKITFRFNGKIIRLTPKKFMSLFPNSVIDEQENYFLAIVPNLEDDFAQISYVNGLETYLGGSHIDYIMNQITYNIREKLQKKKDFKGIKPGDIKSKMLLVIVAKDMKNVDWDGQTKASITSPVSKMKEYFCTDFEKFAQKILRNDHILLPITELFTLRAKAKENAELKKLKKTKKKPKSDKFMPPIGEWKNLFYCEGDSAANNASQMFDRTGNGFFAAFGVPPNTWNMSARDILKSKKLLDIQHILGLDFAKTEQTDLNFKNIIIFTDYDLPGHFIAGQMLAMLYKYGKNLFKEKRVKRFVTPLIIAKKNEKLINWFYTFETYQEFQRSNSNNIKYEYKKGIGSWDSEELIYIIEQDGLDKMMLEFIIDEEAENNLINWFDSNKAEERKKMLENYEFNIMNM